MRSLHQQTYAVEICRARVCYTWPKTPNHCPGRLALSDCCQNVMWMCQAFCNTALGPEQSCENTLVNLTAPRGSRVARCSKLEHLRFGSMFGRCDCSGNVLSSMLKLLSHAGNIFLMLCNVGPSGWKGTDARSFEQCFLWGTAKP